MMDIDQYSKLTVSEERYDQLTDMLADTDLMRDQKAYVKLVKEHADLMPLVQLIRQLRDIRADLEENRELARESDDQILRELAREEINELEAREEEVAAAIMLAIEPKDENDERNVIVEIRAGTGGDEAALFAADLYRMYAAYAESRGWETEIVDANETEIGGFKEIVFMVEGRGAYSRLKYESGAHRVQRVPVTEAGGRIHTSAVTVAVLPEVDEVDFEIDPKDLQIDTYRASGAGGQHVNKTSSAIRLTHIPSGAVVQCQNERSQHKNRAMALKMLKAKLVQFEEEKREAAMADKYKNMAKVGFGSQIRNYFLHPDQRVKDARTGHSEGNFHSVLDGHIQEFLDAFLRWRVKTDD